MKKINCFMWALLLTLPMVFTACSDDDDDNNCKEEAYFDKEEAQTYIKEAFNEWDKTFNAEDFYALNRAILTFALDYAPANQGTSVGEIQKHALQLLEGNISTELLWEILIGYKEVEGVYTADANKVFQKVADSTDIIQLNFKDANGKDILVKLAWVRGNGIQNRPVQILPDAVIFIIKGEGVNLFIETEVAALKSLNKITANIIAHYNTYSIDGSFVIKDTKIDALVSIMNGNMQIARVNIDGVCENMASGLMNNQVNNIKLGAFTSSVILGKDVTLYLQHNNPSEVVSYMINNKALRESDSKAYHEGLAELRNKNDIFNLVAQHKILCKIKQEAAQVAVNEMPIWHLIPYFEWNDASKQTIDEFASDTTDQRLMKDLKGLTTIIEKIKAFF